MIPILHMANNESLQPAETHRKTVKEAISGITFESSAISLIKAGSIGVAFDESLVIVRSSLNASALIIWRHCTYPAMRGD